MLRKRRDYARGQCSNAAMQQSQAPLAQLSRELGISPKTVVKSRKRATVGDMKTGPKELLSTVLTEEEEASVVACRRHKLLPLDDCLYALQPSTPRPTRSALHWCLQRHRFLVLAGIEGAVGDRMIRRNLVEKFGGIGVI